jgi:methionyl-tRNA synthetase
MASARELIAMVRSATVYQGVIPLGVEGSPADQVIFATVPASLRRRMPSGKYLAIHEALAVTWTLVDELNGYITIQEPWACDRRSEETRAERLDAVLYTIVRGLGTLAVLLSPVIPDAAATVGGSRWHRITDRGLGMGYGIGIG